MGETNMTSGLDVTVVRSEGSIDVAVSGEIDIATVDRFREVLRGALLEAPASINLDLLSVGFMGSVGINTLIEVRMLAVSRGIGFRIVKASRRVESVLDLMGLSEHFD